MLNIKRLKNICIKILKYTLPLMILKSANTMPSVNNVGSDIIFR